MHLLGISPPWHAHDTYKQGKYEVRYKYLALSLVERIAPLRFGITANYLREDSLSAPQSLNIRHQLRIECEPYAR